MTAGSSGVSNLMKRLMTYSAPVKEGAGESPVSRGRQKVSRRGIGYGAMPSEKIKCGRKGRGISNKTLWRAKTEMDIAARSFQRIDGEVVLEAA